MQCQALELTATNAKEQWRVRGAGEQSMGSGSVWAGPTAAAITVISNVISKLYNIKQTLRHNRRRQCHSQKHFYEIVFVLPLVGKVFVIVCYIACCVM